MNIFKKYNLPMLEQLGAAYQIPNTDMISILLNVCGAKSDPTIKRIRSKIKYNWSDEWFYFGLANRDDTPFKLTDEGLFFQGNRDSNYTHIGSVKNLENDDCASSYFRKNNKVLTLNTNKRSTCVGCKFCPNTLQLNNNENLLTTETEIEEYFKTLIKSTSNTDMSFLEEVAHCTGCYGSEEACLTAIHVIMKVLHKLNFNGRFHYIGSEIISNVGMLSLKNNIGNFPIYMTFSIECFTNRQIILKNCKAAISLDDYKKYMELAMSHGFRVTYIYVLGLDSYVATKDGMKNLYSSTNRFPIVNIFQPHEAGHLKLLDGGALGGIEYYLEIRKHLELLYGHHLFPYSWECYRPLFYRTYNNQLTLRSIGERI